MQKGGGLPLAPGQGQIQKGTGLNMKRAAAAKMGPCQRLASAALATAAVLGIAACGSTLPSTPGSDPAAGAPQAAPSDAAPQATSSSDAPQGNSDYPYEPAGVTFSGEGEAVYKFSIPAGSYVFNEQASYDPANDPTGLGDCMFSGEWDHMWDGASAPIGVNIPISPDAPINGPASTANFQAGNYRLYIYPGTTCSWTITLLPNN
jgi:hypothetical protein